MPNTSYKKPVQLDLFAKPGIRPLPSCSLVTGGRRIAYTLKRSLRARRVWLRIGIGTGLVITVPARMPLSELNGIIKDKSAWIEKNLARAHGPVDKAARPGLKDGVSLPLFGRPHTLRVRAGRGAVARVRLNGGEIEAVLPGGDESLLKDAVESWYKEKAREVITGRVESLRAGRDVRRVSIKDQKTRWGSCSATGNLSFNWRLVMAPPQVVDYIIVHELTHLERMDHSRRFWEKVAKTCPDYKESAAWLKKHGPDLSPW